ncbi:hypothetical protein JCM16418A_07960 [Paenibacillus pini]
MWRYLTLKTAWGRYEDINGEIRIIYENHTKGMNKVKEIEHGINFV